MNQNTLKGRYIEGVISIVTPLHVASQSKAGKSDRPNPTYTTKMPVSTDSGPGWLPYFPGSDLRGRMRRRAAAAIMEKVQPVPLAIYHALTCGANVAAPDTGPKSIKMLIDSRDDLYLGLFGGGPRLHKSGMQVRSMYPIVSVTDHLGMIPEGLADRKLGGQYKDAASGLPNILMWHDCLRIDPVLKGMDMMAPRRIKDYAAAAAAWEARISENKGDRQLQKETKEAEAKEAKKDKTNAAEEIKFEGLSNMYSIEAIMPGTQMYLRIGFDDFLTDAQVCFAAQNLFDVMSAPIGGKINVGMGVVRIDELDLVSNGQRQNILNDDKTDINPEMCGFDDVQDALENYSLEGLSKLLISHEDTMSDDGTLQPRAKKTKKSTAANEDDESEE